ncbi:TspO/MBR family protein [Domibacillus sp. 8LH]|uniref:TspO/MBR family protein n=1 Tax=Domibacillus sp. 8LH TaxID=3073900 RepID=UPI0031823B5F
MNVLNGKKLAASVLLPVVGGSIIGAVANRNTREDYRQLKKPSFSPPGWVFPVVWTGLYTAMGIAKYRASVRKPTTALPYNIQLGLNYSIWSLNRVHS